MDLLLRGMDASSPISAVGSPTAHALVAMTPLPSEPGLQDLFFQPGDVGSDFKPAAG
ncbi:MAG: hypothetical protein NTU62_16540 [Spirochaetes bacterium]|nr:hypothetical protein [Spirochaetota bacterium]